MWIVLSDTIINRAHIVMVFRDNDDPSKVWVRTVKGDDTAFGGDDARLLWEAFSKYEAEKWK
jgi:hypothetical protein